MYQKNPALQPCRRTKPPKITQSTPIYRLYGDYMIQGLVQIFLFQALGELFSKFALPFIPGPVLGLVFLLTFLIWRNHVPAHIDMVGSSILQNLGLLFIPASVGVVLYFPVLRANAWAVGLALVGSVVVAMAVTALILKIGHRARTLDEENNHAQ